MPPITNIVSSIQARLQNLARAQGVNYQIILEQFGLSRFMARLSQSTHSDKFTLKGAQLFRIWDDQLHRPTKDIDFSGQGESDPATLTAIIDEISAITPDMPDGLEWAASVAEPIRAETAYGGSRINLKAMLGNAKISIQIDIGFGDSIHPSALADQWPAILDYPPVELRVYPIETVIAEKLEALFSLGLANSRMKDFYDLYWITTNKDIDLDNLSTAIRKTFARRNSPLPSGPTTPPIAFTTAFYNNQEKIIQWNAFLRKNKLEAPSLEEVLLTIQSTLPIPAP